MHGGTCALRHSVSHGSSRQQVNGGGRSMEPWTAVLSHGCLEVSKPQEFEEGRGNRCFNRLPSVLFIENYKCLFLEN